MTLRVAMALAILLVTGCSSAATPIRAALQGPFRVTYVYDGDTIEAAGEKIRLLSIDTPESTWNNRTESEEEIRYGLLAKAFTEDMLLGRDVYLQLGVQERDRYGRLLAWVFLEDPAGNFEWGGRTLTMANLEIVARGWGEVLVIPPNVNYETLFRNAQDQARRARLGIWNGWLDYTAPPTAPLRIRCAYYNPPGTDAGNEAIVLEVLVDDLDLQGYVVGDDEGLRIPLRGHVFRGELRIPVHSYRAHLSNRGDTILLVYQGNIVDRFTYKGQRGQTTVCRNTQP